MKKNKEAEALGKLRWKGKTPAERKYHSDMMNRKLAEKRALTKAVSSEIPAQ